MSLSILRNPALRRSLITLSTRPTSHLLLQLRYNTHLQNSINRFISSTVITEARAKKSEVSNDETSIVEKKGKRQNKSKTKTKAKAKSSTSSRWNQRQSKDPYTKEAQNRNLRSRAAFKLLQIDEKFHIFPKKRLNSKRSTDDSKNNEETVEEIENENENENDDIDNDNEYYNIVDLGFAPGAWSQVARERTKSKATILGVDILPCNPPKGVNAMQANILSKATHERIREFFFELEIARRNKENTQIVHDSTNKEDIEIEKESYFEEVNESEVKSNLTKAYAESRAIQKWDSFADNVDPNLEPTLDKELEIFKKSDSFKYPLNLVLSDMCAPFVPISGFNASTTNLPIIRMSNTSGLAVKDHLSSMDLCDAALILACDLLKPKGHMVIKFFMGAEDNMLENRLKNVFVDVKRFKPKASRSESKEAYFICKNKKKNVDKVKVFQSY